MKADEAIQLLSDAGWEIEIKPSREVSTEPHGYGVSTISEIPKVLVIAQRDGEKFSIIDSKEKVWRKVVVSALEHLPAYLKDGSKHIREGYYRGIGYASSTVKASESITEACEELDTIVRERLHDQRFLD